MTLYSGLATGAIAEQMGVSLKTIETYRSNIKTKLNLKDATVKRRARAAASRP